MHSYRSRIKGTHWSVYSHGVSNCTVIDVSNANQNQRHVQTSQEQYAGRPPWERYLLGLFTRVKEGCRRRVHAWTWLQVYLLAVCAY